MELPFLKTQDQITGNEATCNFLHETEAANLQESYCINTLGRPSLHEHHYRSNSTFFVLFENKTRIKVQVVSQ